MRSVLLYLVVVAIVPLWSVGCSYSVDRSKICKDGEVTEEGYGLACETDEELKAQCEEAVEKCFVYCATDEGCQEDECLALGLLICNVEEG